MSIIVISRGSYTHGREVAEKVAKALNYEIISREKLIESAAKEFNVPEIKLLQAEENAPSFLERITYGKERYIAEIESGLLTLLKKDNVIYHGFAGHFFVRDIPCILKVRIIADIKERVKLVMERDNVSEEEALRIIKKLDEERSKWSRHLYGIDIADPSLYNFVIQINQITVDDAVDIICHAVISLDSFKTTSECLKTIENRAIAAKIRALLIPIKPDIEVTYDQGIAYIKTTLPIQLDEQAFTNKIKEACANIPEVKEVKFEIFPLIPIE